MCKRSCVSRRVRLRWEVSFLCRFQEGTSVSLGMGCLKCTRIQDCHSLRWVLPPKSEFKIHPSWAVDDILVVASVCFQPQQMKGILIGLHSEGYGGCAWSPFHILKASGSIGTG